MDAPFLPKRPYDSPAVDRPEPFSPSAKRRHHSHIPSTTLPNSFRQPPPPPSPLKLNEALFRILCPANKTRNVIGKGGAVVRQLKEETGAKIRVDDYAPHCEERVIIVIADSAKKYHDQLGGVENPSGDENYNSRSEGFSGSNSNNDEEGRHSAAQVALVKVFERILKADEEGKEEGANVGGGTVCCRLLAPGFQVGCVLGRGGKVVEKIRQDTGAQIKVFPRDQLPACAFPGDELIQITGNFLAVRKALLLVSGCLQDKPQGYGAGHQPADHHSRGHRHPGSENIGPDHRMLPEEEVVFKLLCQVDKVGSLIGKGGSVVRVMETETGASIKISEAALADTNEKVVVISARENSEQRHSPAQDAVLRVHGKIAEISFERGAPVVARLLFHPRHMDFLFGKGGALIAELRRITGASIRVFPKEHVPKYGSHAEELVQITGSLPSVQDALFQITSRLREYIFPLRPPFAGFGGPPYRPPHPDMSRPLFRPGHDPASPGYPSPAGSSKGPEPSPALPHGMDYPGPAYSDHVPNPYSTERRGHGQMPPSPGWNSQPVGSGAAGASAGSANSYTPGSESSAPQLLSNTVEVVIPHIYLKHVYGENNSNLDQIRQISGSNVVVRDSRPGAGEGLVALSGTLEQTRTAQILIHAFILAEQHA